MRKGCLFALTAAVLASLGSTCASPETPKAREAALRTFGSAEEMRAYLASQATAPYRNNGAQGGFFDWLIDPVTAPAMEGDTAGGESDNGSDDYSTTNVQEPGVDESDIVKNDGNYIYTLSGDLIHIIQAVPVEEMAEVATVEIETGGHSLYLRGKQLVAISSGGYYGGYYGGAEPGVAVDGDAGDSDGVDSGSTDSNPGTVEPTVVKASTAMSMVGPWYDGSETTVTILDVSDPANPVASKTIRFEGNLASSRVVGDKLHLVLTTLPQLPYGTSTDAVESVTLEEWLPDVQVISSDASVQTTDAVSWQNALRPAEPNGYAMTVVATVDLADLAAPIATTSVTANVETVYASTSALYLTDTAYNYDDFSSRSDTTLHKLAFTDTGTEYIASGRVAGRPLSQYSLSEYQDYLRIATTSEEFSFNGEELASAVFVLGVNDAALEVVGKVENIASGEKIYAARFMGDRGFLVTFRRIDPLFTMDLSNPADPRIVGELKVPGFSDHIQLLDANHLLTVGRNAEEADGFAWVQGVMLTIFDITDMADPQILEINGTKARVEIGGRGTYSEACSDPKAFNFYPAQDALALPIDLFEGDTMGWNYGEHAFTGLYVYRVTVESGFELLGRIGSSDGANESDCYIGYSGSTRGVFIGDHVYSVTGTSVQAASLDDVDTIVGEAEFAEPDGLYTDCFWVDPPLILPASEDLR